MVESNILLIALQQTKNNGKIKEYILYGEHTHFQFKHFIEFSNFFQIPRKFVVRLQESYKRHH